MIFYINSYIKKCLVFISLLFGTIFNFFSSPNDSLINVFKDTNENLENRLRSAYDLSWEFFKSDLDSAKYFANFLHQKTISNNILSFFSLSYATKSEICHLNGNKFLASSYCDSTIKYAQYADSKNIKFWANKKKYNLLDEDLRLEYIYSALNDTISSYSYKAWLVDRKRRLIDKLDLRVVFLDSMIKSHNWPIKNKSSLFYKLAIDQTDMGDFKNGITSLDSCLLLRKKILHNDSSKSNIRNYANTLTVIGTVYADLAGKLSNKSEIKQNCNEANYYFNQAKIFFEKIGDKSLIALVYGNISSVYLILENYDKAYENTIKDLNINLSINNYLDVADAKIELSEIYIHKKEYDSALIELKNAKKMLELNHLELKISDEYEFYENFGSVYDSLKKYNNALLFYNKAYNVALEINSLLWIENMSNILYKTYKKLGKNKKALNMYKSYILNRDSLKKMQAVEETMAMELERKYELKKQEDSIRNFEKKKLDQANLALKKTQLKEEKSFTIGVGILLVAIIVFAILILFRFIESIKQRKIIVAQKLEVDNAFSQLEVKNKELVKKNSEIMDSIHYAKYIQQALLPDEEKIQSFFGNEFVFNFPKDVVGGDFHWFKSYGDQAIIVAADCTGHGVPGGFVTMLGSLLIGNSVKEKPKDPNDILSDLNRGIVKILKQHKKDSIQDGMDISICLVDKKKRIIKFSGARNGLYVVKNNTVETYRGDLTPVGGYFRKKKDFDERNYELTEIKLNKDEWVFMYSDGYYDQFGGPKNKSMGSTRFKKVLLDAVKDNKSSSNFFKNYFLEWKGEQEQIDDVLLIGFSL